MAASLLPRWFSVRLLVWAVALAWPSGVPGQDPARQSVEFRHNFRDAKLDDRLFRLIGPEAMARIKADPEGLRMTLPAEQEKPDRIGLKTAFGVRGDFTVTAAYQILKADRPKAGAGVGFLLYLLADTPTESGFAFFRVQRVKEGDSYMCSRRTVIGPGKRKEENDILPAAGASGQLRVARAGSEITVSVAEGDGGDFRELRRYEFGRGDLKYVEATAYPGRTANAVDLRVTDLHIRAESLPGLAPAAAPSAAPPSGLRFGLVLIIGALLLGLATTLAVYLSRRRKNAPAAPGQETMESSISFRCPACGKGMKARAGLSGKAVKCPHCRHDVPVPVANSSGNSSQAD
jgi:hypothetical protein